MRVQQADNERNEFTLVPVPRQDGVRRSLLPRLVGGMHIQKKDKAGLDFDVSAQHGRWT